MVFSEKQINTTLRLRFPIQDSLPNIKTQKSYIFAKLLDQNSVPDEWYYIVFIALYLSDFIHYVDSLHCVH